VVVSFLSSLGSMGSVDVPRDGGGVGICDISLLLLTIFQCMWLLSKCYLRASFESGIFSRSHVCPTIPKSRTRRLREVRPQSSVIAGKKLSQPFDSAS
jgi:hypothetical protein